MPSRYKFAVLSWLFILAVLFLAAPMVKGQSILPELEQLTVELWPEYDRADVLVIYRAELSPDTTLPIQLTVPLPGYIEAMHAVAVERDGSLFAVDPEAIELREEDEDNALLLTFPATTRKFQLEYYDPRLLTRQGQDRQLDYSFSSPYEIERITFQVQEPIQAEGFLLTPTPTGSFTDPNGLTYSNIDMAGLVTGDTVELTANYKRPTDQTSLELVGQISLPEPVIAPNGASESDLSPGYLVLGAGVLLLVVSGGAYWWWSRQADSQATHRPRRQPVPRRTARRKKRASSASGRVKRRRDDSAASQPPVGFCYRCGTALRPEATYCHSCGATRRQV
jgi:hypothetical protein